uniref:Protein IDA-LIKE 2 n=1 Tax=Noccaea caerulescens TaxID=107243 RepID=A0A1J3E8N2_NOCCA
MGKKDSSQLNLVLVLVLLICLLPCLSQSAPFSATVVGRRLMSNGIVAGPSTSGQGPKKNDSYHGRRLMSTYFPNAGIRAGPSTSGQGGGRNPVASP